ncbi:exported hypothetical protein [Arthrobacter sp. 9AX]|nr:exported hypothetical protein [Arthrobacter sp. 9AX]
MTPVRSRLRMSFRVSQPLRSTSSHAYPNSARSYPVLGALPLMGRLASRSSALVTTSACAFGAAAACWAIASGVSGLSSSAVSVTAGADDGAGAASAVGLAWAGAAAAVLADAAASRSAENARGKATAPATKSAKETLSATAPDFRRRFAPVPRPR